VNLRVNKWRENKKNKLQNFASKVTFSAQIQEDAVLCTARRRVLLVIDQVLVEGSVLANGDDAVGELAKEAFAVGRLVRQADLAEAPLAAGVLAEGAHLAGLGERGAPVEAAVAQREHVHGRFVAGHADVSRVAVEADAVDERLVAASPQLDDELPAVDVEQPYERALAAGGCYHVALAAERHADDVGFVGVYGHRRRATSLAGI